MNKNKEEANPSTITFLIENKKDLDNNRAVTKEEAEKYAKNIESSFEISTLKKEGINELINLMINKITKPAPDNYILQSQPKQTNFCPKNIYGAI